MQHNTPEQSQLGKNSAYVDQYDADLLFPIARVEKREEIGITSATLPFMGADLWTGFELSWLNLRGKPQVALLQVQIPCETPNIIESKSFKLYLNSFNNTRFASEAVVRDTIFADLNEAAWRGAPVVQASVGVRVVLPEQWEKERVQELEGMSLDRLDCACTHYTPAPELLKTLPEQGAVTETVVSNLLKSNCLVTGQPDWGSVQISYSGSQIDHEGLLRYIVSFRNHNEFHEQCVERIYMDIMRQCKPTKLSVYARYTRRGGLDISPFRTSHPQALPQAVRTARQ
mgnify:CR=1 FL=1